MYAGSTQKLLGDCFLHSELWFSVSTLFRGAELLQMFNNHLSDIQCLFPFKVLKGSKVAGLFCSSAQSWAMPDSIPVE